MPINKEHILLFLASTLMQERLKISSFSPLPLFYIIIRILQDWVQGLVNVRQASQPLSHTPTPGFQMTWQSDCPFKVQPGYLKAGTMWLQTKIHCISLEAATLPSQLLLGHLCANGICLAADSWISEQRFRAHVGSRARRQAQLYCFRSFRSM